ncbi:site-specific DNA-methyltransferase [Enterococcus sp. AN402]|uniref:DNA-methyltransferase n=1 Tax=Enterococcus sp. AN402 TaxID=3151386 RepID=UPI00345A2BFE
MDSKIKLKGFDNVLNKMELDKIYLEDCIKGMKKIPDGSIDCIICDLPYGTTACSWDTIIPFENLWEQYNRITKEKSPIVLFGAEPFSTLIRMSNLKQFKYDWYWLKNNVTGFTFAKTQPMRQIETISVFGKSTPNYYPQGIVKIEKKTKNQSCKKDTVVSNRLRGKEFVQEYTGYPKNILRYDKESKGTFHPTQKPVALLEYLIKTYTKENDVVLDNCMGSGTTAIACLNTNRRFIGFETNEDYYRQSLDRIKNNVTQVELF